MKKTCFNRRTYKYLTVTEGFLKFWFVDEALVHFLSASKENEPKERRLRGREGRACDRLR